MNKTENTKTFTPYYGLGGWLAYLQVTMIGVILYRILRIVIDAVEYNISFLQIIEILFTTLYGILSLLSLGLIITSFIFLRLRSMLFRTFYLANIGVVFLTNCVMAIDGLIYWSSAIGGVIGISIWIAYLFKSERIKNTLRKVGQEKTEYEIYIEEVKSESSANNENELQENIR